MKDKKETQKLVKIIDRSRKVVNPETGEVTLEQVEYSKTVEDFYKVGDEVKAYGKTCKIVEVLEENRFHCKNLESPFDSFVVLVAEFE